MKSEKNIKLLEFNDDRYASYMIIDLKTEKTSQYEIDLTKLFKHLDLCFEYVNELNDPTASIIFECETFEELISNYEEF